MTEENLCLILILDISSIALELLEMKSSGRNIEFIFYSVLMMVQTAFLSCHPHPTHSSCINY